jgi:sulfite exporter TauE/SafE
MQLYALSTGSFWGGALSMLAFALGTLPALALLSASPVGSPESRRGSVFFKVAGLVVIAFAFLNVAGSLVAAGVLPPFFSF